jgi:oligopeptide transport system substrate-binding protein
MKKTIRIAAGVLLGIALIWWFVKPKRTPQERQEKVLYIVSNGQVQELDPIRARDNYTVKQISQVYEGLLEYHYLKRPLTLVPNLAEAMPTISADQRVYTFKLRRGVFFQDDPCFKDGKGRELVADDFVYSLKRLADPKLQALNFWVIDNKLEGLNEWREKSQQANVTDYAEEIAGLRALDRYTLQFTLKQPYPQFLYALAMKGCYVVPHEAITYYGTEFINHPVGTGPFVIENFNPQDTKITFRKNPTFRDKRFPSEAAEEYRHMLSYAGKKLPFVDKIVTHIITEEYPRWLKFKKGEIDAIDISRDQITGTVVENGRLASELVEKGIQYEQAPELSTHYIGINNSHPLFKNNRKLRQAISLAFDRETYNQLFFKGSVMLAQSFLPPRLAGYQADYVNPYRTYDLEKAKKYLAEAGYPEGKNLPEITLDIPSTTDLRQKGEFIRQCMGKIGIRVNVIPNIFPEMIKKTQTTGCMLHTISWAVEYPDAENFFQLLYSKNQQSSGLWYHDPVFDSLYEQASGMSDSPERTKIYEKINQMIAEEVPIICVFHPSVKDLRHGWVKNYLQPDCIYGPEQYVDIDLAQQKALKAKLEASR